MIASWHWSTLDRGWLGAKQVLSTSTLTDTVDAALDEVIALQRRRELVDLLFADEGIELDRADVTGEAWR